MTLQEQIDALPEWPKGGVPVHGSLGAVIALEHQAMFARLALAREIIALRVQVRDSKDFDELNALLAALSPEPPAP